MPISGIGKVVHDLHEPFPGRHKIGIENGDELARCHAQALIQSSRLEAMTIDPVNVGDPVSQGLIKLYGRLGNFYRAVGGVVQNLNLQLVGRIVQVAAGLDQPVNDELLVEDGELHGDAGKFGEVRLGLARSVLAVLVVAVDQLIAMNAIEGENDHHDEVGNQECGVKRVPVIQVLEGAIGVMGLEVMLQAVLWTVRP